METEKIFYVYAIRSLFDSRIYVGMSENVEKRVLEHNNGKTRSTKASIPWELVYTEKLPNRATARSREKYLKTGSGKEWLKAQI